jgi:hypothetical protein
MKRTAWIAAAALLAAPSASAAVADDGPGPLGVTVVASAGRPFARVGALFGADRAGHLAGGHFCTASVVHSPHHDLVVTAAHCLDGSDGTALVFVPGYRDGRAPYGIWPLRRQFLPDGWAAGGDEDSDVAFGVLGPVRGREVEDVVGAYRFVAGTAVGATAVTLTGYPDAREAPVTCSNRPRAHGVSQQRLACPGFTGGTSGSPWVNGDGEVVGVLGGHERGGTTAGVSYSVVLGREATALYREAAADP